MNTSKCCIECGHSGIFFEIGRGLSEDATGKGPVLCAACLEDSRSSDEASLSADEDAGTESVSASPGWMDWAVAHVWPGNVSDEGDVQTDVDSRSASDDDSEGHRAKRLRTQ
eukprot:TRINITY_DN47311_c0_g1_i1.p2 TRINITY_DN47311_c0_g1~~TRINITY_DN47311_c0_g1_i1.p2  ORF type:complete len:112 (-),score=11.22 TRINITY_DN47311_c0_g1_i1:104-439(-)